MKTTCIFKHGCPTPLHWNFSRPLTPPPPPLQNSYSYIWHRGIDIYWKQIDNCAKVTYTISSGKSSSPSTPLTLGFTRMC